MNDFDIEDIKTIDMIFFILTFPFTYIIIRILNIKDRYSERNIRTV